MNWKKGTAFLLSALLTMSAAGLSGCKDKDPENEGSESSLSVSPEVTDPEQKYKDNVYTLANCVALAADLGGMPGEMMQETDGILEGMGWYHAVLNRIEPTESLTYQQALDFQKAMGGGDKLIEIPSHWIENGRVQVSGEGENRTFSFPKYIETLDQRIGQDFAMSSEILEDGHVRSMVKYYDDGNDAEEVFCVSDIYYEKTGEGLLCRITKVDVAYTGKNSKVDLDLIGGSIDFVKEQNSMVNLLKTYDDIRISWVYEENEGLGDIQYSYFPWENYTAMISSSFQENGETSIFGISGPYNLFWDQGRFSAEVNLTAMKENRDYSMDTEGAVSNMFEGLGEITSIVDDGADIIMEITVSANDFTDEAQYIFTLDKGLLHLKKMEIRSKGKLLCTAFMETNAEKNDAVEQFEKEWEKTRTVTFCYIEIIPDQTEKITETQLQIPVNWEVIPYVEENAVYLYRNKDLTEEYTYPGDNVDYTIYFTNAAG